MAKIFKNSFFHIAQSGRLSLQIAQIAIGNPAPDSVIIPDDWIHVLKNGAPVCGKEQGYTCLTRKGFEANKAIMQPIWDTGPHGPMDYGWSEDQKTKWSPRGHSWEDFVAYAETHFVEVDRAKAKKIASLKAKLQQLEDTPNEMHGDD